MFPTWTATLSAMVAHGTEVAAGCTRCKGWRKVNTAKLMAVKGPDYSLINRRTRPCRFKPGCTGWNRFHYRAGVFRPLWDDGASDRWITIDVEEERMQRARMEDERLAAVIARMREFRECHADPVRLAECKLTAEDLDFAIERLERVGNLMVPPKLS